MHLARLMWSLCHLVYAQPVVIEDHEFGHPWTLNSQFGERQRGWSRRLCSAGDRLFHTNCQELVWSVLQILRGTTFTSLPPKITGRVKLLFDRAVGQRNAIVRRIQI